MKKSCFLLLVVLAAGCVSKDGTNCRYRVTHEKKREFGPFNFNAKHQIEFDVNTRERITEEE